MTDLHLSLAAAPDQASFPADGGSVRHLVAHLAARRKDDRRPAERQPVNIALVIDVSSSMSGGKLGAAQQAALGLASRLDDRDRLSLVSFASDVAVHLDGVAAGAANGERIRDEILGLATRGMTNLSDGWFAGVHCAAQVAERHPRLSPRVILLSDGHANQGITDRGELCEHAGELRLRGVQSSALGIGDGYDEQLLRGIAENGAGRLHDAELDHEISSVLLGELEDIFGTLADDAWVEIEVPASVGVELLGTGQVQREGAVTRVAIGPVQNAVERVAVFRLVCPRAAPGDRLTCRLRAGGRATDDGSALAASPVTVEFIAADGGRGQHHPRDAGIAATVARHWSAHVAATTARLNRDGAHAEAQRYVEAQLAQFRRYAQGLEGGPDWIGDLELLARRAAHAFSPRMGKELALQSQLFLQGRADRRGEKESWRKRMERGD